MVDAVSEGERSIERLGRDFEDVRLEELFWSAVADIYKTSEARGGKLVILDTLLIKSEEVGSGMEVGV